MTQKINKFIIKNMIYCKDTHSLVHRLYEKWKKKFPTNYDEAQTQAWDVIEEMNKIEKK